MITTSPNPSPPVNPSATQTAAHIRIFFRPLEISKKRSVFIRLGFIQVAPRFGSQASVFIQFRGSEKNRKKTGKNQEKNTFLSKSYVCGYVHGVLVCICTLFIFILICIYIHWTRSSGNDIIWTRSSMDEILVGYTNA